jgi:hypothetical protein
MKSYFALRSAAMSAATAVINPASAVISPVVVVQKDCGTVGPGCSELPAVFVRSGLEASGLPSRRGFAGGGVTTTPSRWTGGGETTTPSRWRTLGDGGGTINGGGGTVWFCALATRVIAASNPTHSGSGARLTPAMDSSPAWTTPGQSTPMQRYTVIFLRISHSLRPVRLPT